MPQEQLRDDQKTYHKMTLIELTKLSPFLDWVAYFREAFMPIRRNITKFEPIIVYSPEYFGNLTNLIGEYLVNNYNKTYALCMPKLSSKIWLNSFFRLKNQKSISEHNCVVSGAANGHLPVEAF